MNIHEILIQLRHLQLLLKDDSLLKFDLRDKLSQLRIVPVAYKNEQSNQQLSQVHAAQVNSTGENLRDIDLSDNRQIDTSNEMVQTEEILG